VKKIKRIEMIGGGLDPIRQLVQSEPAGEVEACVAGDRGFSQEMPRRFAYAVKSVVGYVGCRDGIA
jgi:hypothetical protein